MGTCGASISTDASGSFGCVRHGTQRPEGGCGFRSDIMWWGYIPGILKWCEHDEGRSGNMRDKHLDRRLRELWLWSMEPSDPRVAVPGARFQLTVRGVHSPGWENRIADVVSLNNFPFLFSQVPEARHRRVGIAPALVSLLVSQRPD